MEHIDIVDENDTVIGRTTRPDIYASKHMHRIVHVFVINAQDEVYLQQRSPTVGYLPGYWCTSAAGHVLSGETYEDAAKRELAEEIGIDATPQPLHTLRFLRDGQDRFMRIFVIRTDDTMEFRDGEVTDGAFMHKDEALALIRKNEKIHPQLAACYEYLYANWP